MLGSRKFSNSHCDLIPQLMFFFIFIIILISFNAKVPLILHTKFQPNIPSHSGGNVDSIGVGIFSICGHLGILTTAEFYHYKALESDHTCM